MISYLCWVISFPMQILDKICNLELGHLPVVGLIDKVSQYKDRNGHRYTIHLRLYIIKRPGLGNVKNKDSSVCLFVNI